jgi:hypothetical protein
MKHIGIVAVSTEGAALCYRTICLEGAAVLGPHTHPEISLHNFSLSAYQRLIDLDDWGAVGEILLASAKKLVRAEAELLICPDNTIHQGLDLSYRRRGDSGSRDGCARENGHFGALHARRRRNRSLPAPLGTPWPKTG